MKLSYLIIAGLNLLAAITNAVAYLFNGHLRHLVFVVMTSIAAWVMVIRGRKIQ